MASYADAAAAGGSQLPVFVFPTQIDFFVDDASSHKQLVTLYNPYDFAIAYRVLGTAPDKYSVVEAEGSLRQRCCQDIVIRHLATSTRSNVGRDDRFRVHISRYDDKELCGRKDIVARLYATRSDCDQQSTDANQFSGLQHRSGSSAQLSRRRPGGGQSQQQQQQQPYPFPPGVGGSPMSGSMDLSMTDRNLAGHPTSISNTSWLAILVGLVCVCALSLPTTPDPHLVTSRSHPESVSGGPSADSQQVGVGPTAWSGLPGWLQLSLTQKLTAAYVLGIVTVLLVRPTT